MVTTLNVDLDDHPSVLDAVYNILGQTPSEWLVLVGTKDGKHVMTAHYSVVFDGPEILLPTVGALVENDADHLAMVLYTDQMAPRYQDTHYRAMVRMLQAAVLAGDDEDDVPLNVDPVILVTRGRWYSLTCTGTCCPRQGTPMKRRG